LTGVLDVDGDVDFDPIVDLDQDRILTEQRRSWCNVDGGVDVHVAAQVKA
jgi:hypothetical protein